MLIRFYGGPRDGETCLDDYVAATVEAMERHPGIPVLTVLVEPPQLGLMTPCQYYINPPPPGWASERWLTTSDLEVARVGMRRRLIDRPDHDDYVRRFWLPKQLDTVERNHPEWRVIPGSRRSYVERLYACGEMWVVRLTSAGAARRDGTGARRPPNPHRVRG